ncbi:phosphatase 2C-like domain-containing protein [Aspergillus floccosus]
MGTTHRFVSHLWDMALNKLFPKRASCNRNNSSLLPRETFFSFDSYTSGNTTRSEHADGFYMYSQDLLEEARRRDAQLRTSADSTDISYTSALMSVERSPLPYTVSSPDWNIYSDSVRCLDQGPEEDVFEWLDSVLSVFSRVYAVAKIVVIILMHYGIEVEDCPDSILAHLRRAEDVATAQSVVDLVDAVENLYYACYARLMLEIANVELCATYELDVKHLSNKSSASFLLPEPNHLLKIYLCCREVLDAPNICHEINMALVHQYQDAYIRQAHRITAEGGFILDELLGYRACVMGVLTDRSSLFHQHWDPEPLYTMPPAELLSALSEKYLAFVPKAPVVDPVPGTELPWVSSNGVDSERWERQTIRAHRQATLAKLEHRAIGDVRRDDGRRRLRDYLSERQCVCRATCTCASACTADPERPCPCAERMRRIAIVRHRGPHRRSLGVRSNSLAKAIFEGVAAMRRDVDDFAIAVDLERGMELIGEELAREMHEKTISDRQGHGALRGDASDRVSPTIRSLNRLDIAILLGLAVTGYALCAKRPSRPFPPPFVSPPSSSFSDPLTTHSQSQDKRLSVRGELVRGLNNGDDAVLVADRFLAVNDGVGAWATKPRGHAALWSRLLLHYWALEVERAVDNTTDHDEPDPIEYLQRAYEETTRATSSPSEWYGTTTSVTALLHCTQDARGAPRPRLYVTNLGDCKVLVVRPRDETVLFRTEEQWHWFDCPMQLGTNSVDTPRKDAVLSTVDLEEGDMVLAVSDGVLDNLWEHEVVTITLDSLRKWEEGRYDHGELEWTPSAVPDDGRMVFVARELLTAALAVAQDPFAESPYMEKAIEEGLAIEGGKMDDISVVIGACRRREG